MYYFEKSHKSHGIPWDPIPKNPNPMGLRFRWDLGTPTQEAKKSVLDPIPPFCSVIGDSICFRGASAAAFSDFFPLFAQNPHWIFLSIYSKVKTHWSAAMSFLPRNQSAYLACIKINLEQLPGLSLKRFSRRVVLLLHYVILANYNGEQVKCPRRIFDTLAAAQLFALVLIYGGKMDYNSLWHISPAFPKPNISKQVWVSHLVTVLPLEFKKCIRTGCPIGILLY